MLKDSSYKLYICEECNLLRWMEWIPRDPISKRDKSFIWFSMSRRHNTEKKHHCKNILNSDESISPRS